MTQESSKVWSLCDISQLEVEGRSPREWLEFRPESRERAENSRQAYYDPYGDDLLGDDNITSCRAALTGQTNLHCRKRFIFQVDEALLPH